MKRPAHLRVAHPPPRPLMLFDGDCHFCTRWIERWKEMTGGNVDYAKSQDTGAQFPEIPASEFEKAVQFIETDGTVYRAAEAVLRSLGYSRHKKWTFWCYEHVPGFAALTEAGYGMVAHHRMLASAGTRFLWGSDVRRPTYFAARRGFLKTLGLVYLFAFISLWTQVDGLMGEHGLLPASEVMTSMREAIGVQPLRAPTLCWWSTSDASLHALCLAGTGAAALLALGLLPVPALLVCFACYLSLVTPGGIFFSYQWDVLLLETGFVAVFLAPLQWRLRRGGDAPVSGLGLFLAKVLLFKIMFMSGVVKLTSGDPSWLGLTALDYHYWTQPLPTVLAWFSDHHPEWVKKACVAIALFVEIVVPFFILTPRRLRMAAAWLLLALQVAIALTGNYCFFNLLVVALCLLLFDDGTWAPRREREQAGSRLRWPVWVPAAALIVTLPLNLFHTYSALAPEAVWPRPLGALDARVGVFRIANSYGLFRVMTKERQEIIFEGSTDAFDWVSYEFKWKPGDVQRMPQWNAPHQPRLDWSMWFAALGSGRDRAVAERLAAALLRNEPSVVGLLAGNPFPRKPPQFLRATVYEYGFTTAKERKEIGAWWKRELRREYLPTVSLKDFER
ncbi:MAG: lipase maturation factor family protein [Chthoniobacterales bacterium]